MLFVVAICRDIVVRRHKSEHLVQMAAAHQQMNNRYFILHEPQAHCVLSVWMHDARRQHQPIIVKQVQIVWHRWLRVRHAQVLPVFHRN